MPGYRLQAISHYRMTTNSFGTSGHHMLKAMSGFPLEAANALESLLALELKLSYLSAMTPQALKDYTECQVRRAMMLSAVDCVAFR